MSRGPCAGRSLIPVLLLLATPAARPAEALLRANFRVTQVTETCRIDDSEGFGQGDPDLYFRAGIFDSPTIAPSGVCATGCVDDGSPATIDARTVDHCGYTTTCGTWNFTDTEFSKVIPGLGGAYFYFGLWDDDVDADDSMGDHWFVAFGPTSGSPYNNNGSPYYAANPITAVCGNPVEAIGWSSNYRLHYSAWFTDDTGPSVSTPTHLDNTTPSPVSNDNLLRFVWDAGVDLDSGISGYDFTLYDVTAGVNVFLNTPAPASRDLTICPSGCNRTYTPVNGHAYRFRVRATNGASPTLLTTSTTTSDWVDVSVTLLGVDDAPAAGLDLERPAPSPTRGPVRLGFTLPRSGPVRLSVFDPQGREVARVRDGAMEEGRHDLAWDGLDRHGRQAAPGVYVVKLAFGNEARTRKLVIGR